MNRSASAATDFSARALHVGERRDEERRRVPVARPRGVPRRGQATVVQHGAVHRPSRAEVAAPGIEAEAPPVRVREQDVVVLGEEPDRRRRVRVGPRRIGPIEQLAAALVTEPTESGATRSTTSRIPVNRDHDDTSADGGRPERAEVAQHNFIDRRHRDERSPEPRLDRGRRDLCRPAPQPARRYLHEREVVPARVRERGCVEIREFRSERAAELRPRARLFGQKAAREREDRFEIDTAQLRCVFGVAVQLAIEHGLDERAQQQRVVGGHEVQCPAHHHDADHLAIAEQLRERLGIEVDEA